MKFLILTLAVFSMNSFAQTKTPGDDPNAIEKAGVVGAIQESKNAVTIDGTAPVKKSNSAKKKKKKSKQVPAATASPSESPNK